TSRVAGQTTTVPTTAQARTASKVTERANRCFMFRYSEYQRAITLATIVVRLRRTYARMRFFQRKVHRRSLRTVAMHASRALMTLALLLAGHAAYGQQRPLDTQDPEPIGTGRALIEGGATYAHSELYPLSGLQGDLWQLPVLGFVVGLGPIAD